MKFWRRTSRDVAPSPTIGDDRRVYAIGDVHGRADLLDALLAMIAQDDGDRHRKPISLILLGDLIDRGADSRAVVERAMALCASGGHVTCLKGNHEEAFVMAAQGDVRTLPVFRRMEGDATLASYGLDPALFRVMTDQEIADWMVGHIPRSHVEFLDQLPDYIVMGDYLFVHAGIRPNVAIEDQQGADMRWIRQEFLRHKGAHPKMIIHGHSISPEVDEQAGRIGIDTGAFFSGRLTAIGLEGTERWILQTGG
ncbi:metallophosphoesterase family protein [Sphingobium sp.]|uniref:metallophosphoesterase family protein n=1 Tax=Sphingobium sp. TaxID=1912891 RepID=UPI003B3AD523